MDQSDSDRIQELCSKIAVEQDRHKFLKLVEELNRVLSARDKDTTKNLRAQDDEPLHRKDD
jgi:hypothetical protein